MNNLLTGIPETDMQIMLRLDTVSLAKFCQISQDAQKICNDPHFWKIKFDYVNLPILEQQYTIGDWIDLYDITTTIVNNTKLILDIHYIEATRKHDPLNIIMMPFDNHVKINTLINTIFNQEIKNIDDDELRNLIIELHDKKYKLTIEWITMETGERKTIETYTDKNTVMDIMIHLEFFNELNEILDQLSIEFLMNYNQNLNNFSNYEIKIINKRFGIRDCLQ